MVDICFGHPCCWQMIVLCFCLFWTIIFVVGNRVVGDGNYPIYQTDYFYHRNRLFSLISALLNKSNIFCKMHIWQYRFFWRSFWTHPFYDRSFVEKLVCLGRFVWHILERSMLGKIVFVVKNMFGGDICLGNTILFEDGSAWVF